MVDVLAVPQTQRMGAVIGAYRGVDGTSTEFQLSVDLEPMRSGALVAG